VQAEEGVLDRVLGARLVTQQQLGHPDQGDRVRPVQVPDQIAGILAVRRGAARP
jgi:hypothetical protein